HDAIEACTLKATKPVGGNRAVCGCRCEMDRWWRRRNQRFQFAAPRLERLTAKVPVPVAEQVKEDNGRRSLLCQKIHALCGGMQAQLQCVEIEAIVLNDDNFSVEHAAWRQGRAQWPEQLREISVERLFVTALDEDFISIAKYQCAKPIPFGFENPVSAFWSFTHWLGQHRQYGRVDGKVHTYRLQVTGHSPATSFAGLNRL